MNTLEIGAVTFSAAIVLLFFCWCTLFRHLRNRKKPDRVLMISDCIQPNFICKTVPCQHPYYRVISEYNNKTRTMPDIEEKPEESSYEIDNFDNRPFRILPEKPKRFLSHEERSKPGFPGLPRRYSMAAGSYRKHSSSISSSRRSSDASSTTSSSITPIYQTIPSLIT